MDFSLLSNNSMNHGHDIKLTQDYYTTTTELFLLDQSYPVEQPCWQQTQVQKQTRYNHWYISRRMATTKG